MAGAAAKALVTHLKLLMRSSPGCSAVALLPLAGDGSWLSAAASAAAIRAAGARLPRRDEPPACGPPAPGAANDMRLGRRLPAPPITLAVTRAPRPLRLASAAVPRLGRRSLPSAAGAGGRLPRRCPSRCMADNGVAQGVLQPARPAVSADLQASGRGRAVAAGLLEACTTGRKAFH